MGGVLTGGGSGSGTSMSSGSTGIGVVDGIPINGPDANKWKDMADSIQLNAGLAFLEEFRDSMDWRAALVAAIVQQVVTVGSGFIAKRAASLMKMPKIDMGGMWNDTKSSFKFAGGGQIGRSSSWETGGMRGYGWFSDLFNPFKPPGLPNLPGLPNPFDCNPFSSKWPECLWGAAADLVTCAKLLDPEYLYKTYFLDIGRATLKGALTDLLTPGEYDNPANVASWINEFNKTVKAATERLEECGILPNLGPISPSNVPVFGTGGRMYAGEAGIVGDLGPELWVPDRAGTVFPNNKISQQSVTQNITIPITVVTEDGKTLLRKSVQLNIDELKRRSSAGEIVIDARGVGATI